MIDVVLYLNHFTAMYGSETSLLSLVNNMSRREFDPLVVLPDDGSLTQRLREAKVRVITMPLNPLKAKNPIPYARTVSHLVRVIRRERVSLVHANCDLSGQYGIVAARLAGVPCVCSTRNLLGPRAYRRSLLGLADALVANSRTTASTWLPNRRQIRAVIHNAVDASFFAACDEGRDFRKRLGLPPNVILIGVIARVVPQKGQDIFVRAFVEVLGQHPTAHALIVGDSSVDRSEGFLRHLHQLVAAYGIESRVTFCGHVEQISRCIQALDLLVCPSLSEPFGRIIIEAMATGKPVVATRSGGPEEIVVDGVTGLLVPAGQAEPLAEAVLKIAANPTWAAQLGQEGKKRAHACFGIKEHVRRMQSVYHELLEPASPRPGADARRRLP